MSHPRFYIARSSICVNAAGETIGDGVFARCNYEPGDFIASRPRPVLASLETERLNDTCANCFVWTQGSGGSRLYVKEGTKVQACGGCKRFRYCSKACQKEAWHRGHKHECKNLRSIGGREVPKAVLGCMELLVRKKHGLISDEDWEMLCSLDAHIEDFKRNGKYGNIELMAMGTSQFSLTQDTFDKDFVAEMYARILANSLTLITPTLDPLGIMIDSTFCHLNHSCEPNACLVMDGPVIRLVALDSINKDEEIYISYIDPTNPSTRRQNELKERWFFDCKCTKCREGPTQKEDVFLVNPEDAPEKCKEYADSLLQRDDSPANDPANYIGDSLDERRLAALQGELFNAYEEQQRTDDLQHAIRICNNAIDLCSSSGLWPERRQPLPALRDDLIVHLLEAQEYDQAWAHCSRQCSNSMLVLYNHYHPIKIVQRWRMAMLAQYLASTNKETVPGVDMAMTAFTLVHEIELVSKRIYGLDSAFSRSVQEKAAEIQGELSKKYVSKEDFTAAFSKHKDLLAGKWPN
ncbi:SET domain-containing protein [Massarina eburnea CBS 473.64]|uniref:SET domain-containing protein n=1 Tax=Massarina eburnea CBS 473.64 TaxID=1395130 RepID=A0A6A6RQ84_9PLEO|nr:SET domain-containing protein [Massarina eburnea CBS 473.64]